MTVVVDEGDVCQSTTTLSHVIYTIQVDLQVCLSYSTDSEATTHGGIECVQYIIIVIVIAIYDCYSQFSRRLAVKPGFHYPS